MEQKTDFDNEYIKSEALLWVISEYGDDFTENPEECAVLMEAYYSGYEKGKSEWIPINDRFPKEEQSVLVYVPNSPFKVSVDKYSDYGNLGKSFKYRGVSHWMPLPEPPQSK